MLSWKEALARYAARASLPADRTVASPLQTLTTANLLLWLLATGTTRRAARGMTWMLWSMADDGGDIAHRFPLTQTHCVARTGHGMPHE